MNEDTVKGNWLSERDAEDSTPQDESLDDAADVDAFATAPEAPKTSAAPPDNVRRVASPKSLHDRTARRTRPRMSLKMLRLSLAYGTL